MVYGSLRLFPVAVNAPPVEDSSEPPNIKGYVCS